MKRKLSNDFLKTLAELRAKELFTKEFFETCTDSWYGDEFFRLKGEVTYNGIINKLHEVLDDIDEGQKRYKRFSCTDDIINHLKSIGNYFVNKYNRDYKTYKENNKNFE